MVTSADGLASGVHAGFHVQTFSTFPSQILGGPTWTQTRISTRPVRSSGDQIDVLVCFNREAYDTHKDEVAGDGVIIYNLGDFQIDGDGKSFGIPFEELAKSTGNARAENMVVIGAFAHLVNMPQEFLDEFVTKRFTRGRAGDDEIIRSNIEAMLLAKPCRQLQREWARLKPISRPITEGPSRPPAGASLLYATHPRDAILSSGAQPRGRGTSLSHPSRPHPSGRYSAEGTPRGPALSMTRP